MQLFQVLQKKKFLLYNLFCLFLLTIWSWPYPQSPVSLPHLIFIHISYFCIICVVFYYTCQFFYGLSLLSFYIDFHIYSKVCLTWVQTRCSVHARSWFTLTKFIRLLPYRRSVVYKFNQCTWKLVCTMSVSFERTLNCLRYLWITSS